MCLDLQHFPDKASTSCPRSKGLAPRSCRAMCRFQWAFLAGAASLAACAPVENQRGYVPDQEAGASVQIGMDTKDTVTKKPGDPSTAATFGNDVWYYVAAPVEQNAVFA